MGRGPAGHGAASLDEIEDVYRRRYLAFVRTATAILGDSDAAVDAVQDAFASAIRRRTSFRGAAPLEAWLWRIVLNAAREQGRRLAARRAVEPQLAERNGHVAAEADEGLRLALARLTERQRLVVFLRYYADLDYEAIADLLAIRPGTVGATLTTARGTLAEALTEASG